MYLTPLTGQHHALYNHQISYYQTLPYSSRICLPQPQKSRPDVRWLRPRCQTHQKLPLRGHTMVIGAKPLRIRHRKYDVAHTKEMRRKTPRQPRLSAARLECVRHLLRLSPLWVETKCLWQEATPHKSRRPVTSCHFPRVNLSGCQSAHNFPVMVVRTPRC